MASVSISDVGPDQDYGSAPTGTGNDLNAKDAGGRTLDLIDSVLAAPSGGGKPSSATPPAANDDSRDAGQKTLDLISEIQSAPAKAPASSGSPAQNKIGRPATLASVVGEGGSGLSSGAIGAIGLPFDIAAGVENLGIRGVNALTGSKLPLAEGGSQRLSELFGAVDPRMNPANNPPQNLAESIARGAGAGAGGAAVLPGVPGLLAAGGLSGAPLSAAQTVAGPLTGGNIAVNAAAGAGGESAASLVPDRFKPAAQMLGSATAGGVATPMAELPTVARGGVNAAKGFAEPLTTAGQQRIADRIFAQGVNNRSSTQDALDQFAGPTVPGSNLTTAQATGDVGVGSMERAAETATPVPFNARRAEQASARVAAVKALQPTGDPAELSSYLRQQMAAIDAVGSSVETHAIQQRAAAEAQGAADVTAAQANATGQSAAAASPIGIAGGGTPEAQGAAMRDALATAKAEAKARERALWKAVDPDNTLALPVGPVKAAAAGIRNSAGTLAKPIDGEERAILDAVASMPAVAKFNDLTDLRSRVSAEMKTELRSQGETPAYARLSRLRGSIEDAISSAVEHKAAQESAAVSAGRMAPEETTVARFQREALEYSAASRDAARRGSAIGDEAVSASRASHVSPASGEQISGDGGTENAAGNPGLPISPNFDASAAERLKTATAATKARATTFGQGSVGDALATRGQQGNYRLLDSSVGSKFFKPGNTGAQAVQTFRAAVGNDQEAMRALEGFAGLSLRKAAMRPDGTIDPAKFARWRIAHADALRAMPDIAAKMGAAARATEAGEASVARATETSAQNLAKAEDAVADATASKTQAIDAFQEGAVGKVMGLADAGDVTKTIGGIFGQKDAIGAMRKLANAAGNSPDARDGLRKGIADYLASRAISNTDDVKADTFQTFVRQNKPVLAQAFSPDELKGIEAVAAELSKVNRAAKQSTLPARSNTAMDLLSQKSAGSSHLSPFAEMMIGASAGYETAGIRGAVAGAGVAATKALLTSARAAGMDNVKDLLRGMLLHPELARAALERAPIASDMSAKASALAAANRLRMQFGRVATMTANRMVSSTQ